MVESRQWPFRKWTSKGKMKWIQSSQAGAFPLQEGECDGIRRVGVLRQFRWYRRIFENSVLFPVFHGEQDFFILRTRSDCLQKIKEELI